LISGSVTSRYQVIFKLFLPESRVVHAHKPELIVIEDEVGGVLFSGIPLLSAASSGYLIGSSWHPDARKLGPHLVSRVPPDFVIALSVYCSASTSPLVI